MREKEREGAGGKYKEREKEKEKAENTKRERKRKRRRKIQREREKEKEKAENTKRERKRKRKKMTKREREREKQTKPKDVVSPLVSSNRRLLASPQASTGSPVLTRAMATCLGCGWPKNSESRVPKQILQLTSTSGSLTPSSVYGCGSKIGTQNGLHYNLRSPSELTC